jgi:acetyl esterase/lipase
LDTHRGLVSRLALAGEARVLAIDYRLAPEHPFPSALEDTLAACRWLIAEGIPPERLIIGGDSAGGGLTLATALSLRDAGDPLPAALVCISPWTDLTFSGESVRTRANIDPVLKPHFDGAYTRSYTGEHNPTHPLISPLFADLRGLPPTLIHVGNNEILLSDSTRLEEKMKATGVDVTLEIWEGMWHVFQVFAPYLPEADQSIRKIGAFIKEQVK